MTPVKEDLIYFLKHGEMKNFPLGIHRQVLFDLMGEPEWDNCRDEYCHLLGYGNFEFYFMEPGKAEWLSLIKKASYQDKYRGKTLHFDSHGWSLKLTIEEAVSFLNEYGLVFTEIFERLCILV